jgi:hypothetical protein
MAKSGFSTQDYVKLGHELRDMLGRAHEYACALPNGTSGYLLPENETWLCGRTCSGLFNMDPS